MKDVLLRALQCEESHAVDVNESKELARVQGRGLSTLVSSDPSPAEKVEGKSEALESL